MKTHFYTFAFWVVAMGLCAQFSWAQNPSMTIQHAGITPNDTLWVAPGDSIDFIYGGGGNHPMTSGQGATTSPVFFPTVTVSSSQPLATFALTSIGTYIFHCGTNPANEANWGTIIVQEPNAISPQLAGTQRLALYPNPCTAVLHLDGKLPAQATYLILGIDGRILLQGNMSMHMLSLDVSMLPTGVYVAKIDWEGGSLAKIFSKR